LALHAGLGKTPGELERGAGVREGLVLADPSLDWPRAGGEGTDVAPASREPVHADVVLGAEVEGLGGDLGEAAEDDGGHFANGQAGDLFLGVTLFDDESVATLADARASGDDVEHLAIGDGGEEASRRFGAWLADEPLFFWQTDGSEGAAGTLAVVGGDGRSLGALSQYAGAEDELPYLRASLEVDGHADGDVVGVVADATLGDGTPAILFEQQAVGGDLGGVTGPGLRLVVRAATGAPTFVFVGNELSLAGANGVHLAVEAEASAGERQVTQLGAARVGAADVFVEGAAGVDEIVGDADLFDLFEVVEALAVGEAMERHDTDERIAEVVGGHGTPPCGGALLADNRWEWRTASSAQRLAASEV
jgi:hypothetical protein